MLLIDEAIGEIIKDYPKIRKLLAEKSRAYFAMKSSEYYHRTIVSNVRALYNDTLNVNEFTARMNQLIINQLYAAYRDGMRENGIETEMTRAQMDFVKSIVDNERALVRGYALDIVGARQNETFDGVRARAELWAGRYEDVVNQAKLETAPKGTRLEWVYGDAVHCETCDALNGIVATAEDWQKSGYHPQQPPNGKLECGGWRCQCKLVPTDKDLTEGGIPTV